MPRWRRPPAEGADHVQGPSPGPGEAVPREAPREAVRIYRTQDRAAAHLVATVLAHFGFDARLAGDAAGSVLAAPAAMSLDVRVPGEQAREAVALLGRLTRTDARGQLSLVDDGDEAAALVEAGLHPAAGGDQAARAPEPTTCPRCGEPWEPGFEVCWSCLWELPAPTSGGS